MTTSDMARREDVDTIDDVGGPLLTEREAAVLRLLVEGCTAVAIAHRLGISVRTVQKHLEHLYRKLGVGDRLQAVLAAQRAGLVPTS